LGQHARGRIGAFFSVQSFFSRPKKPPDRKRLFIPNQLNSPQLFLRDRNATFAGYFYDSSSIHVQLLILHRHQSKIGALANIGPLPDL
jgi:hypothetical protein